MKEILFVLVIASTLAFSAGNVEKFGTDVSNTVKTEMTNNA